MILISNGFKGSFYELGTISINIRSKQITNTDLVNWYIGRRIVFWSVHRYVSMGIVLPQRTAQFIAFQRGPDLFFRLVHDRRGGLRALQDERLALLEVLLFFLHCFLHGRPPASQKKRNPRILIVRCEALVTKFGSLVLGCIEPVFYSFCRMFRNRSRNVAHFCTSPKSKCS